MAIKLIAFDWNGTLLADTDAVVKATNIARSHYGYAPITKLQYRKHFTVPIVEFWTATGGKQEDMKTEHRFFHPAYEQLVKNVSPRKGLKPTLSWLNKQGIKLIIYSNHTTPEIKKKVISLKIEAFIDAVLARKKAEDTVHLRKRHKEARLQKYILQKNFQPAEIISVGDTCEEIEAGHNLSLHTVAITGGENTTARLKKQRPDFLIHDLKELIPIVKELNTHD